VARLGVEDNKQKAAQRLQSCNKALSN